MSSQKTTLAISGMHCASCAQIITRRLKKVPGVEEANVNYGIAKAHVTFDAAHTNDEEIIKAVKDAGYGAEIAQAADRDRERQMRAREISRYRTKFWWGLILSAPMLYFMLVSFLPSLIIAPALIQWMGILSLLLA